MNKALNFASEYVYIPKCDIDVIIHARKSLLLLIPIPGLENKEVCLVGQFGPNKY